MHMGDVTQRLADIHISSIVWFVVILSVLRLALVRFEAPAARAIVEIIEAALIAAVLVFLVIQPFFAKAFYIPSPSMVPTLIDDDHILVNKFEYRLESPHHEDIIVFAAPPKALETGGEEPEPDGEPTDYIKRLMGLPGDTIQVFQGYIQAGNLNLTHDYLKDRLNISDLGTQQLKLEDNDVRVFDGNKWTIYSINDLASIFHCDPSEITIHPGYVLRDGIKLKEPYTAGDPDYDLKVVDGHVVKWDPTDDQINVDGDPVPDDQAAQYLKAQPTPIPPGKVFVMGDNRNDSNDSSAWGLLDENRLVGKAFFIFYPFPRVRVLH